MNMKKTYLIILIPISLWLISCTCRRIDYQDNEALKLYCSYAENENLTVAYLSDFKVEEHAINTVMIQANDDTNWDWLRNEFSIPNQEDTNYTVEMGMKWNTQVTIDDNIFDKEYIDDEEISLFAQAIVEQLSEAMNSLLASEGEVQKASFSINDNGLSYKDTIVDTDATIISDAKRDGSEGYVTAVDYENQTLWIFFYDDAEECSSIMTHIRKDIFAYK